MINRIYKKAALVLVLLAAASAFIEPVKLPASILIGGALGIVNFRGMSRGLENMLGTHKPAMRLVMMSIFRLMAISAVIVLLAVMRLVNLPGLAGGFTVVLALVLSEGLKTARQDDLAGK